MTKMTIEQQLFDKLERLFIEVESLKKRIDTIEHLQRATQPYGPTTIPYQPFQWQGVNQCTKCGLQLDKVMGYVCPQPNCPTGLGPVMCKAET